MNASPDASPRIIHLSAVEVSFGSLDERISMQPVVSGALEAIERTVADDDGGFCAIWAAARGVYTRVKDRRGSSMYILSGDAVVTDVDGTAHDVRKGSTLVLPYRWEGTWDIQRAIRKVYIYSTPTGEPATTPAKASSLSGIDALQSPLADDVARTAHRAGLPDARGIVVSDDVDGLCAIIAVTSAAIVLPGSRAAYLYVLAGSLEFADETETTTGSVGDVLIVPAGWSGALEASEDVRAYAFFTTPRRAEERWRRAATSRPVEETRAASSCRGGTTPSNLADDAVESGGTTPSNPAGRRGRIRRDDAVA